MKRQYAKIAVAAATFAIDRPYTYLIPENLLSSVTVGIRVRVPFGKGNRKSEGVVLSVADQTDIEKVKAILSVLDESPVLSPEMLRLALWMRDRFFCTVYDALHAMLPSGMWFTAEGKRKIGDKMISTATLAVSGEEAAIVAEQKRLRAPQQASILQLMSAIGSAAVKDICYFTGASPATVKSLAGQGLLTLEYVETFRRPDYDVTDLEPAPIVLNELQEKAFSGLSEMATSGSAQAALLFGVTGSGKTVVYIRLIERVIAEGRQAIMLVPEIGLTPQFVRTFSAYFQDRIAVLHSSLAPGERYDEWKRIRSGKVDVVIGTRSAVFAPVPDLGIIIIDEEQEYTYKAENAPRYQTRDIAKYRCVQSNALLLLGSATPDIDSMYRARNGQYTLFSLENRYNQQELPEVLLADMRAELKEGNGSPISKLLRRELEKNIAAGEQSILFINRRGAAGIVMCGECGYVFTCPHCSVSMTYHSANRRFMCHHCGYSEKNTDCCPACGGKLKYSGAGTQKVEEELRALFPDVPVLRMDTDTVSPTHSHEKILEKFQKENIPILVGTQMVTKGLDFENVTLVGVLSADQMLYMNDYKAYERTFSLITQVIGRSGRGEKTGRAVIQTFTPSNEVIQLASKQDYMGFYNREIELRRLRGCPPFEDLFTVTISGPDEGAVYRSCIIVKESFENYFPDMDTNRILGPAPASVMKVNNRYRYKVTVSCANTKRVRDTIAHVIRTFSLDKRNKGLSIFADINPAAE